MRKQKHAGTAAAAQDKAMQAVAEARAHQKVAAAKQAARLRAKNRLLKNRLQKVPDGLQASLQAEEVKLQKAHQNHREGEHLNPAEEARARQKRERKRRRRADAEDV